MRLLEAKKNSILAQSTKSEKSYSASRKSYSPMKNSGKSSRKQSPGKKVLNKFVLPCAVRKVFKNSDHPIDIIFAPMGLSEIMDFDFERFTGKCRQNLESRSASNHREPRSRSGSKLHKRKTLNKTDSQGKVFSDSEEGTGNHMIEEGEIRGTKVARKSVGNKV